MRAFRPFGRLQLIVASLAFIASLAWVAWRWTDTHPGAARRSAAPDPASAQVAVLPQATPGTRAGSLAHATQQAEDPGDPRRRAPDPVTSDDRFGLAHDVPAAPVEPGVGGRIVAIDPETGQLGAPSPEQILELARQPLAVSRTDEVLRETVLANGAVILHLDGRFHDYAVARVDRNGRLVLGCAHDVHGPASALRDSTAARGLEVE